MSSSSESHGTHDMNDALAHDTSDLVRRLRGIGFSSNPADYDAVVAEAAAALTAAEARIAELSEALAWYGENARLCRLIHSEGDAGRNALAKDGGARARSLTETETERTTT